MHDVAHLYHTFNSGICEAERQEDHTFGARMGNMVRPCFQEKTTKTTITPEYVVGLL